MYNKILRRMVNFFVGCNKPYIGMLLGASLSEPWENFKSSLVFGLGWKRNFSFYGLNPKEINKKQASYSPLLLLHGDYHNQSAWLKLAKNLNRFNWPIFTVNLPSGKITAKDFEIVEKAIQNIKALYRRHGINNVKVHLVGHSRGGDLLYKMISTKKMRSQDIGKIIKIGSAIDQEEITFLKNLDSSLLDHFYEIIGKKDVLESKKSLLANQHIELNFGHLALLQSEKVHETIVRTIK